jgi:hypothetical protein
LICIAGDILLGAGYTLGGVGIELGLFGGDLDLVVWFGEGSFV